MNYGLILTRKKGEAFYVIDEETEKEIRLEVDISKGRARFLISAPAEYRVMRSELAKSKLEGNVKNGN